MNAAVWDEDPERTFDCPPAQLRVEDDQGEIVFRIEGEVDLSNADTLRGVMLDHISRDHDCVVLDVSEVRYLDSSSLKLLTELAQMLRVRRQDLQIVAPPQSVALRLLTITGLANAFAVVPER